MPTPPPPAHPSEQVHPAVVPPAPSPVATSTRACDPQPHERLAYSLQFNHLDKLFARLPGMGDDAVAAAWNITSETMRRIKAGFSAAAESAARELLAEPGFADQLAHWPLAPGSTLAAIGDSLTDDWQSWFEILGHALRLHRPDDGYVLLNAGHSGDSTADAISRFMRVVPAQPDWIIAAIGTNDARLHGLHGAQPLISPQETRRNLEALRRFAAAQTQARWLWVTPGRVIEDRIRAHWYLAPGQVGFRNRDLDAIATAICERPEPVLDLRQVFGDPVDPAWLLDDGLHPSLTGHQAIARAVVARLSLLDR